MRVEEIPASYRKSNNSAVTTDSACWQSLPLVIGVTGHRDLHPDAVPQLEQTVEKILRGLQQQYPNTPLMVLSPLAEGADRLVARVGLKCGAQLVVPLPMPLDLYRSDFNTEQSIDEFEELLGRADNTFDLMAASERAGVAGHGPARRKQYRQVGIFVTHYSQVVIALWDGVPEASPKIGGTAEIVGFALKGVPAGIPIPTDVSGCELDAPEVAPVYHVLTRRKEANTVTGATLTNMFPDGTGEAYYHRIFKRLDDFNRESNELSANPAEVHKINGKIDRLLKGIDPAHADLANLPQVYARASRLAERSQERYKAGSFAMAVLGVMAVVAQLSYGEVWPHFTMIACYIILWIGAYGWYRWTRSRRWEEKWLDYRGLDEGLRVQIYWRLAGCQEWVVNHYLQKQRSELDWIRNAMRTCMLMPTMLGTEIQSVPDDLATVTELWVFAQSKYYTDKTGIKAAKDKQLSSLKSVLAAAATLAVINLALHFQAFLSHETVILIHHVVNVMVGLCLAGAGALGFLQGVGAYADEAKQYNCMGQVFSRAYSLLKCEVKEPANVHKDKVIDLLKRVGCEALEEQSDWLRMHRDRLEAPKLT